MKKNNVFNLSSLVDIDDPLTEIARNGAKMMLATALEDEVKNFLSAYNVNGEVRLVRNGYLPERTIQTGIGEVEVKVPRVRDRKKEIKFKSTLIPPYLRKSKSVEELIPWLYLKGISTNDFQEALKAIFGDKANGLSSTTISKMKSKWEKEYQNWQESSLENKEYVYIWADGIHCGVRGDHEKLCLLVIIGATTNGKKELLALDDGFRESTESWIYVLNRLKERGLKSVPKLAIGDGALGFWAALRDVFPETKEQRCCQHKTRNVVDKMPKSLRSKATSELNDIWQAESKDEAKKQIQLFKKRYEVKHPKAVECLLKDEDKLLTFYDFPAEHWRSVRTSNPIESIFASVRHRSNRAKGCVSRSTMLSMAFKLIQSASTRWHRLHCPERLADVITGVNFINGIAENEICDTNDDMAAA